MCRALPLLIFGKSCPMQHCFAVIILLPSEREGEVVSPSPWTLSSQQSCPSFTSFLLAPSPASFLPSLRRLSSPALWWGVPRFPASHLNSRWPGPDSGSTALPLSLSDQRQADLLASIKAHLNVAPSCESMLVTSMTTPLMLGVISVF